MAGFAVRHPSGSIVHPYQWQANSEYTDQTSTGGYYAVCIDNQFSRFAGKLVNMYITVIKYEEWDKYAKEIEALQLDMQNFTVRKQTNSSDSAELNDFWFFCHWNCSPLCMWWRRISTICCNSNRTVAVANRETWPCCWTIIRTFKIGHSLR